MWGGQIHIRGGKGKKDRMGGGGHCKESEHAYIAA
jgi:hypothetical protein